MTGHSHTSGYRYTMSGDCDPSHLLNDRDVGALDAPRCIPAGAHVMPWYYYAPCYAVTSRVNRMACHVHRYEWRI